MSQFNPAPVKQQGTQLVARYVASGNPSIVPVSVDITTGIFTASTTIPLPIGSKVNFITVYPNMYPTKLFSEWDGINSYLLEVLSATTFILQLNGVRIVSYATLIDVTQFAFEYNMASSTTINMSGLGLANNYKVCVGSNSDRNGWRYVDFYFKTQDGVSHMVEWLGTDGRQFMDYYQECEFHINRERKLLIRYGGRIVNMSWSGGTDWSLSSKIDQGRDFWKYDVKEVTSIVVGNLSNGGFIEIYSS